ncbi:MAG: L-fucose/L-arabinose isomerase family protein [Verrucomicrobiota bacterium]|jgi:L-fucose isomerase-like protein|nr:L-fucose/L-arabinose isomerase family protein [Verrucomicrobiota bacterium]HCF95838.1 fucose isomerase [Verrucomicrobiota bacterium]
MAQLTLAVVIGNRGFFPDHLCESGRKTILEVLARQGIRAILPEPDATSFAGAVETHADARVCADLLKAHRDEIDGILVTLPNFGDEKAVSNTIRWSGLDVPVLVHAFADHASRMSISDRRDSFCGKMSTCNNLRQYGIPFSLTRRHTMDPESGEFAEDLQRFSAVCRVVKAMKNLRVGMIGARPAGFNTVRFSEKILEAAGISVETLDLSEVIGWSGKLTDLDDRVVAKLDQVRAYTETKGVPEEALLRIAKLGVSIEGWMRDNALDISAVQCWTSLEEFYGVVPCTLMSMMSEGLRASACETDVTGAIGMHALAAASGTPSALLDWNNNFGEDPDKGVLFHCSNLPRSWFVEHRMDFQEIVAGTVGKANTYGTIVGRIKPGPFTFCRLSTDDRSGQIVGYIGEGKFTEDPMTTFGGYGVIQIPAFQDLLNFICEEGFEHHVSANLTQVADPVEEALTRYLGWEIYRHS